MYQYIKNNQTDVDNVKTTVSSLKKLFKTYKKEIKACLKIESDKTMTAERRNKINQLKNDLNQLEEKEGEARGEVRGEARGIIDTCHDFGLPDEDILKKLQDKMNISLQTAQEYLRMFEKEMV